jgi:hypothetical protein
LKIIAGTLKGRDRRGRSDQDQEKEISQDLGEGIIKGHGQEIVTEITKLNPRMKSLIR